MSPGLLLAPIALVAAIVNGALGYGFSSITVPLALLFLTNRVLNPALVLVEVGLNAWVLAINRRAVPQVWRRVLPVVIGLAPGIAVGTFVVSTVNADWLKLVTFAVLLPLILVQAAGYRRPMREAAGPGVAFGAGVGLLYSVTTISGPPLAVVLNNQGLAKTEFRAALGLIRLAESSATAVAYASVGMFTAASLALIPALLLGIVVGVPIGTLIIQRVNPETFRRLCMTFDAWVVAFGLSRLLIALQLSSRTSAHGLLALVVLIDAVLLARFFGVVDRARRGWYN